MAGRKLTDQFGVSRSTPLSEAYVNRLLTALETRFSGLEAKSASYDAALDALLTIGLQRINEVLLPAVEKIQDLSTLGFLIAESDTLQTLSQDEDYLFVISEGTQRDLFAPSPFVALTRSSTTDDYAIARTISYDPEFGEYQCTVVVVVGDPGPHSDWVIAALAGPTIAQKAMLDEALAAGDEIDADRAAVALDRTAVADDRAAIASDKADVAGDKDAAAASASAAAASASAAEGYADAIGSLADFDPGDYATLDSPALTGTPTAPTAALGTNSAQIATMAAIVAALASLGSAAGLDSGTAAGQVPVLGAGGLLPVSTLPAVAITDTSVVGSQAAMLALTAQRGDIAVRTDLNKSFVLATDSPGALADWIELRTPTDAVLSVAGLVGAITDTALRTALLLGTAALINKATTAEYLANTTDKALTTDQVNASGAFLSLTDGATINWNMALGFNASVTLGGNRTIASPTNMIVGRSGCLSIKQDGTGSRIPSWGSVWKKTPTLSTAANSEDLVFYFVRSSTQVVCTGTLKAV